MTGLDHASDEELLRLALARDQAAFTALYRRRQGAVYRFALRMTGSEAAAEDVTQEVFLTLLRNGREFSVSRGTVGAWLMGIARNLSLRAVESGARMACAEEAGEPAGESSHPADGMERRETAEAVRRAVLALPPHYREVVALCELEEMSYLEAAAVLGCSVGTVRSRLHRARALLLEKLQARFRAARCVT